MWEWVEEISHQWLSLTYKSGPHTWQVLINTCWINSGESKQGEEILNPPNGKVCRAELGEEALADNGKIFRQEASALKFQLELTMQFMVVVTLLQPPEPQSSMTKALLTPSCPQHIRKVVSGGKQKLPWLTITYVPPSTFPQPSSRYFPRNTFRTADSDPVKSHFA